MIFEVDKKVDPAKLSNPYLYRTVKSYVPKAIALLAESASSNSNSRLIEQDFLLATLGCNNSLDQLPEYSACVTALLADPKIKSQLWTMIGTNYLRRRSANVLTLMNRLAHLGVPRGTYTFDPEHFDREYQTFERAFYDDDLVYDVVAPLHNLRIPGPVRLSDEFEISPLTEDDDASAARLRTTDPTSELGYWGYQCAIRSTFRLRKIVGSDVEINEADAAAERKRLQETTFRIDEVINALRLYGAQTVYYPAITFRTSEWLFADERVFRTRMQAAVPVVYEQDEDWLRDFSRFWQLLQSDRVRNRPTLGLAIRRFGYALERAFAEDRLIDLIIACESLFLSDSRVRGRNLSDPLAQRVAQLLGDTAAIRTTISYNIKQAYQLRNAVVHGSAHTIQIIDEHDDPIGQDQFLGIIQNYTHTALRLMIERAASVDVTEPLFDKRKLSFNRDA